MIQYLMKSEIGPLYLVASGKGLTGIYWKPRDIESVRNLRGNSPEIKILTGAEKQIREYLAGRRKKFALTLDVTGTEFQKRVWKELAKIPFGKTLSYREVARRIGKPGAFRAVGTANGKNPVSIVVPCHRVIAADGSLGGYAGGLPTKIRLLTLEQNQKTN